MISIEYHPLVQAVVDAWKKQLSRGEAPLSVSEADLRDLVSRLGRAIEVLAGSITPQELEFRIRRDCDTAGKPGSQ
jgi:hypothetical protein